MLPRLAGFSLVELVIVIVIIGVLAAIAIPRVSRAVESSRAAALKANVRQIQATVDTYAAQAEGVYPNSIRAAWFRGGTIPAHPYAEPIHPTIWNVRVDARRHPVNIALDPEAPNSAYWYNAAHGVVRARVPLQANASDTRKLYASVNGVPVGAVETDGQAAEPPG